MDWLRQRLARWGRELLRPEEGLRARYQAFRELLAADERSLLLVAELEEIFAGVRQVDPCRTGWLCGQLSAAAGEVAARLEAMRPGGYPGLDEALARIRAGLAGLLPQPEDRTAASQPVGQSPSQSFTQPFILPLSKALGRPDAAGGKAANLAAAARAGLTVPPGLVVTTDAFRHFLSAANLRPRLDRLLRQVDLSRPERIGPLCAGMQALVLGARVPENLAQALRAAAGDPLFGGARLAVRSSAVAEDGELSFAGQYVSELDVAPEDIVAAYKRVVAAKYRPRAVTYRVRLGLPDEAAPLAALLMPMIAATAAGVLHSLDSRPDGSGRCVTVFALPGLGEALVAGRAEPRLLCLARRLPVELLEASGGSGADGQELRPDLKDGTLGDLVLCALVLESLFGGPQEVEWALDAGGRLFVLQSRGHSPPPEPVAGQEVVRPDPVCVTDLASASVLAQGLALVAPGLGCGPVHHLLPGENLARVPEGCVLVVDTLSPGLARLADRVAAVVAGTGSRASHFASVARETGLPVVSGLADLRQRLAGGLAVTVDADAGRITAGCAAELLAAPQRRREEERRRLAGRFSSLARQTCHLSLTDPDAPDFAPQGCASLHDVVRYCHEMSVAEMFGLAGHGGGSSPFSQDRGQDRSLGRGMGRARRLGAELPLSLYLLDLGGGLAPSADSAGDIQPEDIASAPMRALWQGLACSGEVWRDTGFCCDWQEFDRLSAGIFRKDSRLLASYALLSADYLHLLARFGYHFAVLDSLCGARAEANYVAFRFKGGGGLPEQRRLRAGFIAEVLRSRGFAVRLRGDMLDARLARTAEADTARALTLLGRLLVRTQRLDLGLTGEDQAGRLAGEFLSACGHGAQGRGEA